MPTKQIKAEQWGRAVIPVPSAIEKASQAAGSILQMAGPGKAIWTNKNNYLFAKEGYTENAEAYACVDRLATAVQGIEFKVFQKQRDDKRTALDEHPLLSLINNPNPEMRSGSAFFRAWVTHLMCAGNTFIERVGPRPGAEPRELWLQRPDRLQIVPGTPQYPIAGYEYRTWYQDTLTVKKPSWLAENIRGQLEPVQQILHSKFFNPIDDWWGLAPMEVAGRAIDQINGAQEWNVSLLQNSARPSGLLAFEDISDDQKQEVEDKFHAKFAGRANAGKTIIAKGSKITYTRISSTAQEMDWMDGQGLSTERICAVFKCPPELIGQSNHRTFSNWHEARQSFYTEAVLPLIDFMLAELNSWFKVWWSDVEIGYDKEEIEALQEDHQYVSQRALDAWKTGAIMRDEYRKVLGMDPLGGVQGQVFMIPTTVVPTSAAGKPIDNSLLAPAPGAPARTQLPATSIDSPPPRPQLVAPRKPVA